MLVTKQNGEKSLKEIDSLFKKLGIAPATCFFLEDFQLVMLKKDNDKVIATFGRRIDGSYTLTLISNGENATLLLYHGDNPFRYPIIWDNDKNDVLRFDANGKHVLMQEELRRFVKKFDLQI